MHLAGWYLDLRILCPPLLAQEILNIKQREKEPIHEAGKDMTAIPFPCFPFLCFATSHFHVLLFSSIVHPPHTFSVALILLSFSFPTLARGVATDAGWTMNPSNNDLWCSSLVYGIWLTWEVTLLAMNQNSQLNITPGIFTRFSIADSCRYHVFFFLDLYASRYN